MTQLVLNGLVGSKPIGAMAAFGLLRICQKIEMLKGAKLGWMLLDDWIPVLEVPSDVAPQTLSQTLAEEHQRQEFPWLHWDIDLRIPPEKFREQIKKFLSEASRKYRESVDFMASFGSDAFVDANGNVSPTLFHMTSGQQKFLNVLQELEVSLKEPRRNVSSSEEAFRQALFGPWLYDDSEHSLGWDPDMERMHALRYREPSKDKTNKSVRAAVWLSGQSLPIFPTSPGTRRLQTAGFRWENKAYRFSWPIWETAVSLPTLKSLLTHPGLQQGGRQRRQLMGMGVSAIFESKRYSFGQGYGIFRPADLIS